MDSGQNSYKKWGVALIFFALIFIPAEIGLTRPNAIQNLKTRIQSFFQKPTQVTVIPKEKVEQQIREDHPSLFFVSLEYDPVLKKATGLNSGGFHGDLPPLASTPSSSSGIFNYKVETISPSGKLLSSGWVSLFESVITAENGKYHFRVTAPYSQGSILNIYSIDNSKLWEEKMD